MDESNRSEGFVSRLGDSDAMVVGLLGFGEVGQVLAQDLAAQQAKHPGRHLRILAYDVLFERPDSQPSRAARQLDPAIFGVADSAAVLAESSDLIICAVTAARDHEAAQSVALAARNAWYLDLNSASPGMKEAASRVIDDAGGRYIEAAVMSPIAPKRINCPMLLGGSHAETFASLAGDLGFGGVSVFAHRVGPASATKMCRSVIVKGMEALLTEAMLSARHYGVESVVLDSLVDLLPVDNWEQRAHYMISRSIEHGVRRAEEMAEVSETVLAAGVQPLMSRACVERQLWAPAHGDALKQTELRALLDAMLQNIRQENPPEDRSQERA